MLLNIPKCKVQKRQNQRSPPARAGNCTAGEAPKHGLLNKQGQPASVPRCSARSDWA